MVSGTSLTRRARYALSPTLARSPCSAALFISSCTLIEIAALRSLLMVRASRPDRRSSRTLARCDGSANTASVDARIVRSKRPTLWSIRLSRSILKAFNPKSDCKPAKRSRMAFLTFGVPAASICFPAQSLYSDSKVSYAPGLSGVHSSDSDCKRFAQCSLPSASDVVAATAASSSRCCS